MRITPHGLQGLLLVLGCMLLLLAPRSVSSTWKGEGQPLEYFILEQLPAGTAIGNVAVDYKLTEKFNETTLQSFTYAFDEGKSKRQQLFSIDQRTGIVSTAVEIDRDDECPGDEVCTAWLHITVSPAGMTGDINIILEILDVNDNRPAFENDSIQVSIPESAPLGTVVKLPTATDVDSKKNGVSTYELLSETDLFALEQVDGGDSGEDRLELKLVGRLDREQGEFYTLRLVAHDGGNPSLSGRLLVNITVADVNDHDPRFDNATYTARVPENGPPGALVAVVKARDFDLGDNAAVTFSFDNHTKTKHGALFEINPTSGRITNRKSLDFEQGSTYLLIVRASDRGHHSRPGEAAVVVRVIDENDNKPVISISGSTLSTTGELEVSEDKAPGSDIARLTVSDLDGGDNGRIDCDLRAAAVFSLRKVHQAHFRLVTTDALDRETREDYLLTFICRDLGTPPNIVTQDVVVRISDVNDNTPTFSKKIYLLRMPINQPTNQPFVEVRATDPDAANNGQIRYSVHRNAADRFRVNPTSGALYMKTRLGLESDAQIRFRVIAADLGSPPKSATATVVLTSGPVPTPPKFMLINYEFAVFENFPNDTEVGTITMKGGSDPADYDFTLEPNQRAGGEDVEHLFTIDKHTGIIRTKTTFDREKKPAYYMMVKASHRQDPHANGAVGVTVYIVDQNDNEPVLTFPTNANHTVFVVDGAAVDAAVIAIRAYDPDLGGNGKLIYTLTAGNNDGYFRLNPTSGVLSVARDLRQTRATSFEFRIQVSDSGDPRFTTSAKLRVIINRTSASVGPEVGVLRQDVVDPSYATVVVAVTAACLITVFLVLFAVMIFLLWRRMGAPLAARRQHQQQAGKYCYSNMEAPAPVPLGGGSEYGHSGRGKATSMAAPAPPHGTCRDGRHGYAQAGPSGVMDIKCNAAATKNTDFCLSIDCEKPRQPYVENNVLLQGDATNSSPAHSSGDSRVYTQNALCTTGGGLVMPDAYGDLALDSDEPFPKRCRDTYTSET